MGGRGNAAFGSHSASVLTKATAVFVVLFFVITLSLALVNKKQKTPDLADSIPEEELVDESAAASGNWWDDSAATEAAETSEAAE